MLHIKTSYLFFKTIDWFLCEMQHWDEMGKSNEKILYLVMSINHFQIHEHYFQAIKYGKQKFLTTVLGSEMWKVEVVFLI